MTTNPTVTTKTRRAPASDSAPRTRAGLRIATLAALALAAAACDGGKDAGDGAPPRAAAAPAPSSPVRFEDVTAQAGLRFAHTYGGGGFDNIVKSVGGGIAVLDFDGDAKMDLYLVNGGSDPDVTGDAKLDPAPRSALYRNLGDGRFEDATEKAGVGNGGAYGFGACAADYDGDGDTDLYVCNYRKNALYRNEGGGVFRDATDEAGVAVASAWSVHAVWLDYDRDGRLDLYVVNYLTFDPNYKVFYAPEGFAGPLAYKGAADVLFHNEGDGKFRDVTKEAGVLATSGRGMSAVAADFDADEWPDLFVSNDAMENFFWRNRGDGTFENVALANGTAYGLNGESTSAMGPAVADYDRNGWLDLFVPDTAFSCLYTNAGAGRPATATPGKAGPVTFRDRSAEARIAEAGGQNVGWGGVFLDADLDGWPDLFRSNGNDHHLFGEQSLFARNRGDGTFEDVSRGAGEFFMRKMVGRGAAVADLWDDGNLSVVVQTVDGAPVLLRNRGGTGNHWIAFDLQGAPGAGGPRKSARQPVGARVTVTTASGTQVDEVRAGSGYLSTSDPRPHFGLGRETTGIRVEIRWPSGARQTLSPDQVTPDRVIRVSEPAGGAGG